MFGLFLRKRGGGVPLAYCADHAPGFLETDGGADTAHPVTVVESGASGVLVESTRPYPLGQVVVGQYSVQGVPFRFRGTVDEVSNLDENRWSLRITYILAAGGPGA